MIFELKTIVDFGIILTIISILVIYFGKLIVNVRKIKKATILNEGILGFSFLGMYVLIPILAIYYLTHLKFFLDNFWSITIIFIAYDNDSLFNIFKHRF